jgi:hypothetical protein
MPLELNGTTGVQGNSGAFVAGTAVASTSGTSIDFTSIPTWVKRVTILLSGVSTNGSSAVQIQIGSGSVTTSGYNSLFYLGSGVSVVTSGFSINGFTSASDARTGAIIISPLSSNTYICTGLVSQETSLVGSLTGKVTLGGVLDRIRITTVNGTDTFDAGSINILYE